MAAPRVFIAAPPPLRRSCATGALNARSAERRGLSTAGGTGRIDEMKDRP